MVFLLLMSPLLLMLPLFLTVLPVAPFIVTVLLIARGPA